MSPEFSRTVALRELDEGATRRVAEKATAEERAALARRLGVEAVRRLGFEATIAPWRDGWELSGVARARVTQPCVVTLEPTDQVIEEPFLRRYAPGAVDGDPGDIDPEAEDPPEPLPDRIDIGEAAVEAVSLAIDPYPRSDGAVFEGVVVGPDGASPLTDELSRPFASLAALREKLRDD